jgi:hypothetical protein
MLQGYPDAIPFRFLRHPYENTIDRVNIEFLALFFGYANMALGAEDPEVSSIRFVPREDLIGGFLRLLKNTSGREVPHVVSIFMCLRPETIGHFGIFEHGKSMFRRRPIKSLGNAVLLVCIGYGNLGDDPLILQMGF